METCPYEALLLSPEEDKVEKCSLCSHRIDQGLEPFCVICCEGQAMHFGDLSDPSSTVSRLVVERGAFQLNPEAGSGPSVFYCPPRERRRL
jgi:Fe-S-cluster-containing dehydrogenase component